MRYAEIENIIYEKYKIEGPSLLDALKREEIIILELVQTLATEKGILIVPLK